MSTKHALLSPGTRPTQLKIDPWAMSHSLPLPHLSPEEGSLEGMSTSFYSSPSANSSAMSPYYNPSHPARASVPQTPEDDALWNLIPYDVPWGPDYFAYRAGRLPGPDGDCLFLRSPTPIEKRRTVRACEKCRERKAKCSGDRPTCVRCFEKGRVCQYTSDSRRTRIPVSGRVQRTKDRLPSSFARRHHDEAEGSTPCSTASSLDFSDEHSFSVLTPKQEVDEASYSIFLRPQATGKLAYGDHSAPLDELLATHDYYHATSQSQGRTFDGCGFPEFQATDPRCVTGHGELVSLLPNLTSSLAPQIHAPRPIRCGPTSLPSLSAATREAGTIAQPNAVPYDPFACVDPSVLMQDHTAAATASTPQSFPDSAGQQTLSPHWMTDSTASLYHHHLYPQTPMSAQDTSAQHMHNDVSVYSDTEIYENPAASQLKAPAFVSYTLNYRYAIDPLEPRGSTLYSF